MCSNLPVYKIIKNGILKLTIFIKQSKAILLNAENRTATTGARLATHTIAHH